MKSLKLLHCEVSVALVSNGKRQTYGFMPKNFISRSIPHQGSQLADHLHIKCDHSLAKAFMVRLGVAENGLPATLGNLVTRFRDHLVFFEKPEHGTLISNIGENAAP
jgi:hypothetical protein